MPDGNPLIIGQANTASNPGNGTSLSRNGVTRETVFVAENLSEGSGIIGVATSGNFVVGVDGISHTPLGYGVRGFSNRLNGVYGQSTSGTAVLGLGESGTGVEGFSPNGIGVGGTSTEDFGVQGTSSTSYGVQGTSSTSYGVQGFSPDGDGVQGFSHTSYGVEGYSTYADGVLGVSPNGIGVIGRSGDSIGVRGTSYGPGAAGVFGEHSGEFGTSGIGVYGRGPAGAGGVFDGGITINGDLTVVNGNKAFKIDHPLDPQNKYLLHNAVESSEMKNVYDGVAPLDENGEAWVELPEWFEALNGDLRYQLTAVGGSAPDLHVAEEVSENRFKIAGGEGGMKVCWQLTGSRKDPWAAANPFEVEQEKPQEERGRYLEPGLYDAPEEQRVIIGPIAEAAEEEQRLLEPPSGIDFARLEEEHRRRIAEMTQVMEARRRELEELRQRMEEEQEEAPPEST